MKKKTLSKWSCYLLATHANKTYTGASSDPARRLRQHNGELSGGARSTRGYHWQSVAVVGPFPSQGDALRFERTWKRAGSNGKKNMTAVQRRLKALDLLTNSMQPGFNVTKHTNLFY